MERTISAVFDAGVLRPLVPLNLAEGTQVEVRIPSSPATMAPSELSQEEVARQRAAIEKFLATMAALPDEGPHDGFSGGDHDKVLYNRP